VIHSAKRPWIVIVGGFLGAGKTTLLLAAAGVLRMRGMRPAVILNDQSADLVDTSIAKLHGLEARDVTGRCFCCRFSDLVSAIKQLRVQSPDVILAEPVGSCTDISATILQPLQEYADAWRLAPYTVLVDPSKAETLLGVNGDKDQAFLFSKQIEEADLICFTKADRFPSAPKLFGHQIRSISAKTGAGVTEWLDEVTSGSLPVGSKLLEIDYEEYARAEAALSWLNLRAEIWFEPAVSPQDFLVQLFRQLDDDFTANGIW
jgi:CobW/HypB/UreG, nucleotide-binding domain